MPSELAGAQHGWTAAWLRPLARGYESLARLRRQAYAAGLFPVHRLPVPVISVGSLAMGGSGKTPVTRWLAERLLERGLTVGVVNGAYGGFARHAAAHLGPCTGWDAAAVAAYGDEAVMLAAWLPRAVVTCGANKLAAARLAVASGAKVIVLDDGFQHQRLARDLNLLVRDGAPVSAGFGREGEGAARAADLLWVHRRDGAVARPRPAGADVVSRVAAHALLASDGRVLGPPALLAGQRAFVLCGIAQPAGFLHLVQALGARLVGTVAVRDHRRFSRRQVLAAARSRADVLLCTEKDAVRMAGVAWARDLVAVGCTTEVLVGQALVESALHAMVRAC